MVAVSFSPGYVHPAWFVLHRSNEEKEFSESAFLCVELVAVIPCIGVYA